jgi:hypothetical protein
VDVGPRENPCCTNYLRNEELCRRFKRFAAPNWSRAALLVEQSQPIKHQVTSDVLPLFGSFQPVRGCAALQAQQPGYFMGKPFHVFGVKLKKQIGNFVKSEWNHLT